MSNDDLERLELPDLPPACIVDASNRPVGWTADQVKDYARAAILVDSKRASIRHAQSVLDAVTMFEAGVNVMEVFPHFTKWLRQSSVEHGTEFPHAAKQFNLCAELIERLADHRRHVDAANTSSERVQKSQEIEHEAAEPVATMHVGMFGSTGFTGLDAGAKLPEGDYKLYARAAPAEVSEAMLDRAEAAVVMQLCSDNNGDRDIARAALVAALGGDYGKPR